MTFMGETRSHLSLDPNEASVSGFVSGNEEEELSKGDMVLVSCRLSFASNYCTLYPDSRWSSMKSGNIH